MKTSSLYRVFGKAHANLASRQINRPCFRRQRGATAIEYAIIAALVAIAIGIIFAAGENGGFVKLIKGLFSDIETAVDSNVPQN